MSYFLGGFVSEMCVNITIRSMMNTMRDQKKTCKRLIRGDVTVIHSETLFNITHIVYIQMTRVLFSSCNFIPSSSVSIFSWSKSRGIHSLCWEQNICSAVCTSVHVYLLDEPLFQSYPGSTCSGEASGLLEVRLANLDQQHQHQLKKKYVETVSLMKH